MLRWATHAVTTDSIVASYAQPLSVYHVPSQEYLNAAMAVSDSVASKKVRGGARVRGSRGTG